MACASPDHDRWLCYGARGSWGIGKAREAWLPLSISMSMDYVPFKQTCQNIGLQKTTNTSNVQNQSTQYNSEHTETTI